MDVMTKVVSCRVGLSEYYRLLSNAGKCRQNVSDYVLKCLFDAGALSDEATSTTVVSEKQNELAKYSKELDQKIATFSNQNKNKIKIK